MSELVYQIQHGGIHTSASLRTSNMNDLYPYIDMRWPEQESPVQRVISNPAISGIRTHLMPNFFEQMLNDAGKCPKFIVVGRNPKDVLISYYHYESSLPRVGLQDETFEEFFDRYMDNGLVFGNSVDHITNWWRYKDHPCVHVVMYESLLRDPKEHIRKIATFLGYTLTNEDVDRVHMESSVEAMRTRGFHAYHKNVEMDESKQSFFRKATKGDWRTVLSQSQQDYVDKQIKEKLHPLGIYFDDWWHVTMPGATCTLVSSLREDPNCGIPASSTENIHVFWTVC